jgi:hypothetical protein
MGVDPVWLGVMIGVNLQTSFLTPPFGFALFYLRGVAGKMLTTLDIYKGVVPFVALQVVGLCVLWAVPALATYLPDRLFAQMAPLQEDARGPSVPTTPSGSPVADDFVDLFREPAPDRPRPYQDDLRDLFPPDDGAE